MFHMLKAIVKNTGLAVLLLIPALSGCTPVQQAATDHTFYSTGQPSFEARFAEPFTLAASGRMQAFVPSDTMASPVAQTTFAVFGQGAEGPVLRHGHVMLSSLPAAAWRWSMETWPEPSTLSLSKMTTTGQFWTIQLFPVPAQGDWFSEFWQANGREAPRFWLAKRWSATPYEETRIVVEYREPAPTCMNDALSPLEAIARQEQVSPPEGLQLLLACRKEIDAFSARADASVSLDTFTGERKDRVTFKSAFLPPSQINMKKLVGEAEVIDRGDNANYNAK